MRKHIMDKTTVLEKSLSPDELLSADEVFLTNAIKQVRWVKNIYESQYSNARTTEIYDSLHSRQA